VRDGILEVSAHWVFLNPPKHFQRDSLSVTSLELAESLSAEFSIQQASHFNRMKRDTRPEAIEAFDLSFVKGERLA
jgi:hypothetical protein